MANDLVSHTRGVFKFPRLIKLLRGIKSRFFPPVEVSANYVTLNAEETSTEEQRLRNSWFNEAMAQRQRELVEKQLRQYRSGVSVDVFDVFTNALRALPDLAPGMSLLEIGCSSGFYSEVVEINSLPIAYTGCDYSPPFIKMACEKYPSIPFAVEDATDLQYADDSFDIVVSGCCLLHIPEYAKAVEETVRVTSRYAVFHRTPVVLGRPNMHYRKYAYGVETIEIHFNEPEFLMLLKNSGLEVVATYTLDENASGGVGTANRTYVCRKIAA